LMIRANDRSGPAPGAVRDCVRSLTSARRDAAEGLAEEDPYLRTVLVGMLRTASR
jgi:hypothetical protein